MALTKIFQHTIHEVLKSLFCKSLRIYMQAGLSLKKCSINDVVLLSRIGIQSYREHYMHLWTDNVHAEWYMDLSFSEESLLQQMKEPAAHFFLIYQLNSPVGLIKINYTGKCSGINDSDVELEKIYLLKKVTNLGIGSWALNQLVQLSKQTGKKILWLKSMDTGNAVKFYQKLGFIETGVVRLDFDGFKDELRNMVIMRLKVD